jgi:ribosomal protein S18 acetylase RimI-like enzyme
MSEPHIVDAMATGRDAEAAAIVFEYVAMTQGEVGRPVPGGVDELPDGLAAECRALPTYYAPPGAILLAVGGVATDEAAWGCVGLVPLDATTVEVKRLYVRAAHRRRGLAGALMRGAHRHARQHGFTRAVLSVMPTRGGAIACYTSLGYQPVAPAYEQPYGLSWFGYEL